MLKWVAKTVIVFKMKNLPADATLTIPQRIEIKKFFEIEKVSLSKQAKRFCIGKSTVRKLISRDSPKINHLFHNASKKWSQMIISKP